jgi:hypothetical protein
MRIPNKHEGYAADGVRLYPMDGGGDGGGNQTSTQIVDLPDWAKPYAKEGLGRAAALTDISQNPYQTYDGSRQAGFTDLQTKSFQGADTMAPSAAMGTAANMAGTAGLGALSAGANFNPYQAQNQFSAPQSYQAGQFSANQVQGGNYNAPSMGTAQTAFNPQLQNYQMGPAERVGTNTFGTQSAQDYMNPYMQNVVDIQKREAQRSADIAGTQRGAQAVKSGAFGGARQAIMDAEAQRNLSQQMGDIQAQGSQAAYDRAAQMFTSDQARQLAAQQANQQAGITTGGQNLSANLATQQLGTQTGLQGALANLSAAQQANVQNQASQLQTQGLNAQQAMQAALANQQYGLETQKLGEQSRQFGAGQGMTAAQLQAQYGQSAEALAEQSRQFGSNLGMQGYQTALTGAGQLANIGQQTFGQEMDVNKLQQQYGTQQQAFNQQDLDTKYQDFLSQQRYPYQQLEFMNSMLRGTPMGTVQSMYQPAPSALSQLAGLGTAAYGVSRMAEGGIVGYAGGGAVGYASGGISGLNPMELDAATDKMSDQQMQGVMGLASVTDLAKMQIAHKLAQNNQIRQAAQQAQAQAQAGQQPQTSIAEEAMMQMGVGGLDVPEDTFNAAGGGIVAFAKGGDAEGGDAGGVRERFGMGYSAEEDAAYKRKAQAEAEAKAAAEERAMVAARDVTKSLASPTTAAIPAAPGLPAELSTVAGIQGLLTNPQITANRATADTMGQAVAEGDIVARQQDLDQYIADQAALGERGTEREKSLKQEQEGLKGAEGKNINMALIEAGLAMMAGNSANAFENIGKGALVGTKAFREGEEKLQARKDKLNESLYALEDARFSDKKVDAATMRGLKKNVADAKTNVQKVMADNFRRSNVDAPEATLKAAVETHVANQRSVFEQGQANQRAREGDAAAMARTIADIPALSAEASQLLKQGNRIAGMPAGPEKDAAEKALAARRKRLEDAARAQYPGGAAVEQRAATAASKLSADIENKINKAVEMDELKIKGMPEGPAKVAAQRLVEERKAQLREQFRRAEAEAGAGAGSTDKVVDFNAI